MGRRVTIYFMSGTGNSYRVASWLSEACRTSGCDTVVLRPIEKADPEHEVGASPDELLGIVMPTHAFTAPWHIVKFLLNFPRRRSVKAFCVSTRAGVKIGSVFPPGVSGTGTFLVALILALKGYLVAGVTSIDMPSNWLALHPGLNEGTVSAIVRRARPKAAAFMGRILAGQTQWLTWNNLYEAVLGALLIPVSVMYLLGGRFYLAKLFFANEKCNGCGDCARHCPSGALQMVGRETKRPYWRFRCESCMRCMGYCPQQAIEVGHSWAVLLYYVTAVPVAVYLFAWLGAKAPALKCLDHAATRNVVSFLYLYASLFLSYLLFHRLLRIPMVNALFAWTTLTRFYRRYHEPDTRSKDLA